jgi:hypothetical protein
VLCGQRVDKKKPEMNSRRLLRDNRGGGKNIFTVGNGHHPGATPGREKDWETGSSHGCLALAGGARRWRGWATSRPGAVRPNKAPSISYVEGALLHSARHRGLCQGDTPANVNLCRHRAGQCFRSAPKVSAAGRTGSASAVPAARRERPASGNAAPARPWERTPGWPGSSRGASRHSRKGQG